MAATSDDREVRRTSSSSWNTLHVKMTVSIRKDEVIGLHKQEGYRWVDDGLAVSTQVQWATARPPMRSNALAGPQMSSLTTRAVLGRLHRHQDSLIPLCVQRKNHLNSQTSTGPQ